MFDPRQLLSGGPFEPTMLLGHLMATEPEKAARLLAAGGVQPQQLAQLVQPQPSATPFPVDRFNSFAPVADTPSAYDPKLWEKAFKEPATPANPLSPTAPGVFGAPTVPVPVPAPALSPAPVGAPVPPAKAPDRMVPPVVPRLGAPTAPMPQTLAPVAPVPMPVVPHGEVMNPFQMPLNVGPPLDVPLPQPKPGPKELPRDEIMRLLSAPPGPMTGVQAPTAPKQQSVSTPSAPRPSQNIETGQMMQVLAAILGGGDPKLLRLSQVLGG